MRADRKLYTTPGAFGSIAGTHARMRVDRKLRVVPNGFTTSGSPASMTVGIAYYKITPAQALLIEKIARLHGLIEPMTVTPTERKAGPMVQSIEQVGDTVLLETVQEPSSVTQNPAVLIEELAMIHGIGEQLVVTPTSRHAGTISQSMEQTGTTTVVTRNA